MRIRREDIGLLNPGLDKTFGTPIEIDRDWSLAAFLRATAIRDGATDPSEIAAKSRLTVLDTSDAELLEARLGESDLDYAVDVIKVSTKDAFGAGKAEQPGWIECTGKPPYINAYLSQFGVKVNDKSEGTRVFVNADHRRVVVWVYEPSVLSEYWVQSLVSVLPLVMTWFFSSATDSRAIAKRFAYDPKADRSVAESALKEYCAEAEKRIDIRGLLIDSALSGFADTARRNQIDSYNSTCKRLRENIASYTTQLGNWYAELDSAEVMLKALRDASPRCDDAFKSFFTGHKDITIASVDNGTLKYGVTAPLQYYDVDEFNQILENDDSWLNRKDVDNVKALTAIMRDKLGVIRVNATFELKGMRQVTMIEDEMTDKQCAPNPHIVRFTCGGSNNAYYSRYAESGDWDLAIEQSCSATRNLAVGDVTVFDWFFNWLFEDAHKDIKFIWVNPDLSPLDADSITDETELISMSEFKSRLAAKEAK